MSINRLDQVPDSTLQSLYRSAVVDAVYRDLMADLCLRAAPIIRAAAEKAASDLEAVIRQRFDIEAGRFLMKLEIKLPPTTDKED